MELLDHKVFCSSCARHTNHWVLFEKQHELKSSTNNHFFRNTYHVIECAGCDMTSYATIFTDSSGKFDVTVYPEEPKVLNNKYPKIWSEIGNSVPDNLKNLYKQIIHSYNKEHNILCGIGLRTLIEAICLELKIKKGFKHDIDGNPLTTEGKKESLEGKIFGLFECHFITWYHALILQRIREIGNAATHQLIYPTSEELYNAIDIVEKLIENIYEFKNNRLLTRE